MTNRRREYVRPGERLVLLDSSRTEVTVRGRDRRGVNWVVVLITWGGAIIIHLVLT